MENLGGKTAVVTGASKGIGRAVAIGLAKCGANVILNYKSSKSNADEALLEIKKCGVTGYAVGGDVSIYEDAKKLVDFAVQSTGKIDILVNNAGISEVGLFIDMKEENWNRMIDVDLKGVMNCTHRSLKYMVEKKSGVIVNISSIWGNVGASCESVYSAVKAGVNLFTKSLAKEMAPSNIRINAVAPGVVDTDMNRWLSPSEKIELEEQIPFGRFAKPEEISNAVVFLCSKSSEYITGQVLTVDGGLL